MTINEIVDITKVHRNTVLSHTKDLFPNKMRRGVKTVFNEKEAKKLVESLKKKGYISFKDSNIDKTVQVHKQNSVPSENVDRLERLELLVEKLITTIPALIQNNQPKQLDFVQDYYTIKGFCVKYNIKITFTEAQKAGKEASKISKSKNIEIRKVDDESYGLIGSYNVDVLKEVFSILLK